MLRWGIIGSGIIAFEMAYAIQSVENNEIEAITSRTASKAKSFADAINVQKVYPTHLELLEDKDINVIYIALPSHLHASVIKDGLRHGKHVLCEKPLTINASEAEEIKALADEKKLFCMEAYWTRFIPSVDKLISLLAENHIGKIRMVRGSFGHVAFAEKELNPDHAEGAIMDLGIYPVALTYALFGKPQEVISTISLSSTGADIQASITLNYQDGMIANLSCSYVSVLDNEYVVYGERGSIKLSSPMYRSAVLEISYYGDRNNVSKDTTLTPSKNYFKLPLILKYTPFFKSHIRRFLPSAVKKLSIPFEGSGYQYQIKHLTDCISKGLINSPVYPLNSSIEVLRILEAVRSPENFSYSNIKTK